MTATINLHCPVTDAPHRWSQGVYPTCTDCQKPRCDGTLGGPMAYARCHLAGNSAGYRFGQWYCPVHAGMHSLAYPGRRRVHPGHWTPAPQELF